ncbi:MAG TPA: hypothetical protein VER04_17290, partial [Polyangiaceae bacterium]|nr:hypothetical protein [Polyangiaceae bacterium]
MSTRAKAERPVSSRRGLLIAGAVASVGGVFAVRGAFSRSAHEPSRTGPGAGAPRTGGELLVAFDGAAVATFALDPHNSGFAPHNRVI